MKEHRPFLIEHITFTASNDSPLDSHVFTKAPARGEVISMIGFVALEDDQWLGLLQSDRPDKPGDVIQIAKKDIIQRARFQTLL